eukprot:m51a1_g1243 hypothetical protein (200) ;mRNA; r:571169-573864
MGEFLPDADQPKGHTTVNLHLGWSHCSFWLELVSDLLSKGHGNSALPSLKLFYYIWLTDFPWLRCIKRKGEHRVCSICAAYWDQNKNNIMLGILGMLVHCGFVDEVFLFFQQPGHTHNDLDQCFSSPSNYFKANNVMSLPEVPEVFTSSWANREFLRSFRVQVSDLKRCYMLANYFESCLINYSSLADLFGFHVTEPPA